MDVDDLRLLRPRRHGGGDELVASVREAPAPPTVAARDDEQRQADDGTNDDARDRATVWFTAVVTAAYVLAARVHTAPFTAFFVEWWAPVGAVPAFGSIGNFRGDFCSTRGVTGNCVRTLGRARFVDRVAIRWRSRAAPETV